MSLKPLKIIRVTDMLCWCSLRKKLTDKAKHVIYKRQMDSNLPTLECMSDSKTYPIFIVCVLDQ